MEVYIVQAYRTAVGKSKRGKLKFTRPDDLAAQLINEMNLGGLVSIAGVNSPHQTVVSGDDAGIRKRYQTTREKMDPPPEAKEICSAKMFYNFLEEISNLPNAYH